MKNKMIKYRFLFAGGGTGGHVYPALTLADEIKNLYPNSEFLFVGTKNKIESRLVPLNGYKFYPIWISGFQRKFSISNLLFPFKLIISILQSLLLLKNYKPNVVIGTGGYVCGPIILASSIFRIPNILHESNSIPGFTTKLLSKISDLTILGFESTVKLFSKGVHAEFIGTPTRKIGSTKKNIAAKYFSLESKKKTILVFGGSLGAKSINFAIEKYLTNFKKKGFQIVWQTGNDDFNKYNSKSIRVLPFIDNMNMAYSLADLIICRSGAISVAEVLKINKKVIFIPYPLATANHQFVNATEGLKKINGKLLTDNELNEKLFNEVILLDKQNNNKKSKLNIDVNKKIVKRIIDLIND